MVLKATVQKQSSKQSLPKVSSEAFFKLNFINNFAAGKHLCYSLILIKLQVFRPATLLKRDSNRGVFPVKFAKFLRTPI